MNLLWISRHQLTNEQLSSLHTLYGEDLNIFQYDTTIASVQQIITEFPAIDIYAVVLPTELLIQLFNSVKTHSIVITPVSERIYTGNTVVNPATNTTEKEYKFKHKHWLQYKKADIVTKILKA